MSTNDDLPENRSASAAGPVGTRLSVGDAFDYWWQVLPSMIVFGFGLATTVSPLTSAILGAVETERSGIASAVNNAVSRVAGLLVIAMLATILGGALDLAGFHRAAIVAAALLAVGGAVSWLGIRNDQHNAGADKDDAAVTADDATA